MMLGQSAWSNNASFIGWSLDYRRSRSLNPPLKSQYLLSEAQYDKLANSPVFVKAKFIQNRYCRFVNT